MYDVISGRNDFCRRVKYIYCCYLEMKINRFFEFYLTEICDNCDLCR